jgi:hypothetical protein
MFKINLEKEINVIFTPQEIFEEKLDATIRDIKKYLPRNAKLMIRSCEKVKEKSKIHV